MSGASRGLALFFLLRVQRAWELGVSLAADLGQGDYLLGVGFPLPLDIIAARALGIHCNTLYSYFTELPGCGTQPRCQHLHGGIRTCTNLTKGLFSPTIVIQTCTQDV